LNQTLPSLSISSSLQKGLDTIVEFLPRLLAFLLILLIGYIVARIVKAVVRKGLEKMGVDRHLHNSDARKIVDRVSPDASPSNGIARAVFWLVFVFFLFSAIGALKVPALTTFMNSVLAYLPNIIAAIIIFVVAAAIAGAAGAAAAKLMGDTPTGKIIGTAVPALVMVIAAFMILEQLMIAPEIVRIAFAATVGALALGLALAFGLGGRPVAQKMLEDAYQKGREQKEQVRRDAELAQERGKHQAQGATSSTSSASSTSGDSYGTDSTDRARTSTYASGDGSTENLDLRNDSAATGSYRAE
jgi:small-conductance mechanosensitive channel